MCERCCQLLSAKKYDSMNKTKVRILMKHIIKSFQITQKYSGVHWAKTSTLLGKQGESHDNNKITMNLET